MNKIIGDFSTKVEMSADEAKSVCKLGEGEKCCAFLAAKANGFLCIRMMTSLNGEIFARLEDGTTNAQGQGGWEGCIWEGII